MKQETKSRTQQYGVTLSQTTAYNITYKIIEEILNSATHGIGFILSIIGLVVMILGIQDQGSNLMVISVAIYGSAMILLYLASTFYHSFFHSPRVQKILRILDHVAIYMFIAGSYTPFALVIIKGTLGWVLFGTVWILALLGIIQKIFFIHRFELLAVLSYVGMGWIGLLFAERLFDALSFPGMALLVMGGLAYTIGVIFYLLDRIPFMHPVWHLFVMAGSFIHFVVIYKYVLT